MGRRRKPRVISLFSGAGGLDYGFEAAGFETSVAVEMDAACCETLRRNRSFAVVERSIHEVPSEELLDLASAEPGDIDVVIGGPPCQPFSKSGYWARGDSKRLDDPRAQTLTAFMRVVEDTLPKVLLLENVAGLSFNGKTEGLDFLLGTIADINRRAGTSYQPCFRVLRAADYGVPQLRERFFLIAARDGQAFTFPAPTHAPEEEEGDQLILGDLPRYRTAWDALADVQPNPDEQLAVGGKWADLLPSIPEGQNYLWHTERGGGEAFFGWRRRFWCFLLKLAKDRPSWTLQAQPGPATGPFHWESRRLSMRELCRLQTFPDDVVIHGSHRAIHKQLGNAVPSLLAEVLGRQIRSQLLGERIRKRKPKLLPPDRSPAPEPEPLSPVPAKYMKLRGEHSPHPGTGKGYRAQQQASSG